MYLILLPLWISFFSLVVAISMGRLLGSKGVTYIAISCLLLCVLLSTYNLYLMLLFLHGCAFLCLWSSVSSRFKHFIVLCVVTWIIASPTALYALGDEVGTLGNVVSLVHPDNLSSIDLLPNTQHLLTRNNGHLPPCELRDAALNSVSQHGNSFVGESHNTQQSSSVNNTLIEAEIILDEFNSDIILPGVQLIESNNGNSGSEIGKVLMIQDNNLPLEEDCNLDTKSKQLSNNNKDDDHSKDDSKLVGDDNNKIVNNQIDNNNIENKKIENKKIDNNDGNTDSNKSYFEWFSDKFKDFFTYIDSWFISIKWGFWYSYTFLFKHDVFSVYTRLDYLGDIDLLKMDSEWIQEYAFDLSKRVVSHVNEVVTDDLVNLYHRHNHNQGNHDAKHTYGMCVNFALIDVLKAGGVDVANLPAGSEGFEGSCAKITAVGITRGTFPDIVSFKFQVYYWYITSQFYA